MSNSFDIRGAEKVRVEFQFYVHASSRDLYHKTRVDPKRLLTGFRVLSQCIHCIAECLNICAQGCLLHIHSDTCASCFFVLLRLQVNAGG